MKKLIGSILVASCILPATVIASDITVEQEDTIIVGGSVTLNFNSMAGTECTSIKLPIGATPSVYTLPVPMKAGHIFKGWFTDENLEITENNPFDAFSTVVSGEMATVKAKWEKQDAVTVTSSITTEEIEDSKYYYDIIQKTENFSDGSKIITNTKTKKIEGFVIEEQTTITYYNQDGSTTQESSVLFKGDDEYKRAKAKNDLTITVVDTKGNPVADVEINFKTTEEDTNLKTDENGKIVHYFKPGTYETKIIKLPDGYASNIPVEKLGLGKMYSISYIENYVLDIVDIIEPPKQEESDTKKEENIIVEESDTRKEENIIVKEKEIKEELSQNTIVEEKKDDKKETIMISNENSNTNTNKTITSQKTPLSTTVQENKDPNNKEIVQAPQTGDNSILFLKLLPISVVGIFVTRKKKDK